MRRSQVQGPSGLQTEFKASVGSPGDPVPTLKMKRVQGIKSVVESLPGIRKAPGSIPTATKQKEKVNSFSLLNLRMKWANYWKLIIKKKKDQTIGNLNSLVSN